MRSKSSCFGHEQQLLDESPAFLRISDDHFDSQHVVGKCCRIAFAALAASLIELECPRTATAAAAASPSDIIVHPSLSISPLLSNY